MSKPVFKLSMDGVDVSAQANDRLLSLNLVDIAGVQMDSLDFVLDARPVNGAFIAVPTRGSTMELSLGYEAAQNVVAREPLTLMGRFLYEEAGLSKSKRGGLTLRLSAYSISISGDFKTSQEISYHNVTLGDIVKEVAGRRGLSPVISPDLAAIYIRHYDQRSKSDSAMLQQMAIQYGAVYKEIAPRPPLVGTPVLYFVRLGSPEAATGLALPKFTLLEEDTSDWEWVDQRRTWHTEVSGQHIDLDTGKTPKTAVPTGMGGEAVNNIAKRFGFQRQFPTRTENEAALKSRADALKATSQRFFFTCGGLPSLIAQSMITLGGVWHPDIPTQWIVERAVHTFTKRGGYATSCSCIIPLASPVGNGNGVGVTGSN